jgi:hypothetical protein
MSNNMQPRGIWPMESIYEFQEQLEGFLGVTVGADNPEEIVDRMAALLVFYPSSAMALASAKYWQAYKYRNEYNAAYKRSTQVDPGQGKPFLTPSILKEYISSRTAEEMALVTRCERGNSAITHTLDALRSILSHLKEERKIQNYAGQV